jgi:hypothetical protein
MPSAPLRRAESFQGDAGLQLEFSHLQFSTTSHDGSPLTAHDVAFSLKALKDKGHPIAQQLLRDLVDAEPSDGVTVVVRFAPNRARDVRPRYLQACLRRDDTMAVGKPSSRWDSPSYCCPRASPRWADIAT